MKTICIAGKNSIAVNGLKYIVDNYKDYKILYLPNPTDSCIDNWQPSFKRYAVSRNVQEASLEDLYDIPELIFISLEFSEIIKPSRFKSKQLFNIHFSLLPKYKGMYTSAIPLLNGEKNTGVTLHKIEKGIDTGDIVDQMMFPIDIRDNARTIYIKYLEYSFQLFVRNINTVLECSYDLRSQPGVDSSYFSKKAIDYQSFSIDFVKTAYEIHNQYRAFTFREYQMPKFKEWQIASTELTEIKSTKKPGTVLYEDQCKYIIATIDYDITLYKDYYPLLWKSAESGNIEEFKQAFNYIDAIDLKTKNGWTALMIATYNGNIEIVDYLLKEGSDVSETNYKGTTVLMYAYSYYEKSGNSSIFKLILDNGAEPKAKDASGKSLFDYMKERNCLDLLHFVL